MKVNNELKCYKISLVSQLKKTLVVAYYTFQDLLKSRVLLNVALIGFALVLVSFVASEFTYGVPQRVALDFGLGTLALSTVAIAILMGSGLVANELESRTIYMILSRPISRTAFLLGKTMGMGFIFIINILLLFILTIGFYYYLGGELSPLIFWYILYSILEALICLFLVLIFSLLTNKILSVIYTFFLYMAGQSINDSLIQKFQFSKIFSVALENYHYILPGFSRLNIKDFMLYQKNLEFDFLIRTLGYGCIYLLGLVFLACFIFSQKDLD